MDFKQRLLARKRFFEEEIQHYQGSDPLKIHCDFISWLENYAKEENIADIYFPVLEETLKIFVEEPIYKQDSRFIRLWLNYSAAQPNPTEVFKNMHNRGLGTECAILYSSWAEQLIKIGSYLNADNVFQMGLNGNIQAKEDLQKQYDDFLKDIGKKVIMGTFQCPKCKTPIQINGTNCNENVSEKVENWEWNSLKVGDMDDFHCPIAHFEEDDPNKPQIRMYPKHKVYPREGQEFSLEEILAAEYEQKYKEEEERERERALAEERERAQAEAKTREEEARRKRKMEAEMFNPPVQAKIPVITPNMMNVPKDMQNSIADSTAITVHTKEAMNVIQDMWSSPAISQVRPRLFQNEKPPETVQTGQFEVYREEEPGAQKTPFQIYDENNGVTRKSGRPPSKPRLLDMNNDENAPPSQQIMHQPNSLKQKAPIEIYQDNLPMKTPDEKMKSTEDQHTKNRIQLFKDTATSDLAEKFETQARIHQPMFSEQDRNNDFSDVTCNTNAFAFVLPSSTPVHKSTNKPVNSIYRNDPSNLSIIFEQSKDKSGNSSTSSVASNNKTVKSVPVCQTDEDCLSENGLPDVRINSQPQFRSSSFYPNTFLDTISEEDSILLSDISLPIAPALSLRMPSQSRHKSPNTTYVVDGNICSVRKSVTGELKSPHKISRKLRKPHNVIIDKENVSPGTLGFPSNSLLELSNSAVPTPRANHYKPLASLQDKENISDSESLYNITAGTGAVNPNVSQGSFNMDLDGTRLEKEKLSLYKIPLRDPHMVVDNLSSFSTEDLKNQEENKQYNKIDGNLTRGFLSTKRSLTKEIELEFISQSRAMAMDDPKVTKRNSKRNSDDHMITTSDSTLQKMIVTATHPYKDKVINDQYQHLKEEINGIINVGDKENEKILNIKSDLNKISTKQMERISKQAQTVTKKTSPILKNQRSFIKGEVISYSREITIEDPKVTKRKLRREKNVVTVESNDTLNKFSLRRSTRLSSRVEGNIYDEKSSYHFTTGAKVTKSSVSHTVQKTTGTNKLREIDVTATHLCKDNAYNAEYQHFNDDKNEKSENILKVKSELKTKSLKQRDGISQHTKNIDKRVSPALKSKRSLTKEIELEFISQSRAMDDYKRKSKRESDDLSMDKTPHSRSTRVSSRVEGNLSGKGCLYHFTSERGVVNAIVSRGSLCILDPDGSHVSEGKLSLSKIILKDSSIIDKGEHKEKAKNIEVENVTSKIEIKVNLKKSIGSKTDSRSFTINKNFEDTWTALEQADKNMYKDKSRIVEYQHLNEEKNDCIKIDDIESNILKVESELSTKSIKQMGRMSKPAQYVDKGTSQSALRNQTSITQGTECESHNSNGITMEESKVIKCNSRREKSVAMERSDITMNKIPLRRSTRVSSKVITEIIKSLPESQKLNKKLSLTQKKIPVTKKKTRCKLSPQSSISVSDTFDPFHADVIENFLELTGFPRAHHLCSYFIKQTNLPTGTKNMKLGDENLLLHGEIGKGAYAKVIKGSSNSTGNVVALKIEKPACKWEYYIAKEIQNRVSPKYASLFMDISAGYIYNNGSILETQYAKYGSLLTNINIYKEKVRKSLDLGVIIHFALELIDIVEHLHKCKIIHADMKADNIVLRELPSRNESKPCLQLIDFGRCIDMSLFPPDTKFTAVFKNEDNKCIEMKENKPWSYQIDLQGLASIFHVLLFTEYMKVHKKHDVWSIQKLISRNLKRDLWNPIFESLLNVNPAELPFNFGPMRDSLLEEYNSLLPNCLQQLSVFNNVITGK